MSQQKCNTSTNHFKAKVGDREIVVAVTTELKSWGYMHWEAEGVLTQEEAREVQMRYGYHYQGYGFYRFKYPTDNTTTWSCSACCD